MSTYRVISYTGSNGERRKLFLNKYHDDDVDCFNDDGELLASVSGQRAHKAHEEAKVCVDLPIEVVPF